MNAVDTVWGGFDFIQFKNTVDPTWKCESFCEHQPAILPETCTSVLQGAGHLELQGRQFLLL